MAVEKGEEKEREAVRTFEDWGPEKLPCLGTGGLVKLLRRQNEACYTCPSDVAAAILFFRRQWLWALLFRSSFAAPYSSLVCMVLLYISPNSYIL